jgi:3-oxoacyl-[acyl-carrier protein] reductase
MTSDYTHKVAVVTGTRKGLGFSIAEHLLAGGATVYGLSRGPGELAHPNYVHLTCDVRAEDSVRKAFAEMGGTHVDILVNNAGVLTSAHSLMLRGDQAVDMLTTNLLAPLFVSRAAVRLMRRAGSGRIINIGSMAAQLEPVGDTVYAATKAGLVAMTNVMAKEYARFRITCNTVGVTAIESDMLNQLDRTTVDRIIDGLTVPRYAQADDVLNVIDFLASDRSSYITAQAIYLGGVRT